MPTARGLLQTLGSAKEHANSEVPHMKLWFGVVLVSLVVGCAAASISWLLWSAWQDTNPTSYHELVGSFAGAFFAFAGWWEVTRIAGEVENPQKNLPKALALGVIAITIIYILTSAVFFYLIPLGNVTSDETFAAQAGEVLFGKIGGVVFASIVVISVFGSLVAYLMVSPRVYYAMAKDGLFFKRFGELHPRFGTPHRATIIQIVLACILILSGTFEQIISYFFFVVVFFIALTVTGLFKIHKTEFSGYKTILYPFTPIFFLLITAIVLLLIAMKNPFQSFLGVAVVLLGLPVYHFVLRQKNAQI